MVDVANNDGEQTEEEYYGSGVDDWVQGLHAGRKILNAAEVLQERRGEVHGLCNNIIGYQSMSKPDYIDTTNCQAQGNLS